MAEGEEQGEQPNLRVQALQPPPRLGGWKEMHDLSALCCPDPKLPVPANHTWAVSPGNFLPAQGSRPLHREDRKGGRRWALGEPEGAMGSSRWDAGYSQRGSRACGPGTQQRARLEREERLKEPTVWRTARSSPPRRATASPGAVAFTRVSTLALRRAKRKHSQVCGSQSYHPTLPLRQQHRHGNGVTVCL